jgi:hypothetical protein
MSIVLPAVITGLLTWGSAAKLAIGGVIHKIWSALVGAEKKAAAEIAKLKADAEAAVKKVESKL